MPPQQKKGLLYLVEGGFVFGGHFFSLKQPKRRDFAILHLRLDWLVFLFGFRTRNKGFQQGVFGSEGGQHTRVLINADETDAFGHAEKFNRRPL